MQVKMVREIPLEIPTANAQALFALLGCEEEEEEEEDRAS
jgi:hypothetical protein